ncbi:hypothetical protein PR048_033763 [Dryococelus australis]|uniref:Histone H2A n=1 Tax=Dryococelus australis TaxID=614101 RepID=A0ABQ9FZ09_9NEOP|nr:hypothetical protein PR048_033763 [Dryococelus australis]
MTKTRCFLGFVALALSRWFSLSSLSLCTSETIMSGRGKRWESEGENRKSRSRPVQELQFSQSGRESTGCWRKGQNYAERVWGQVLPSIYLAAVMEYLAAESARNWRGKCKPVITKKDEDHPTTPPAGYPQ